MCIAGFNGALAPTPDELTEFLAAVADVISTVSPDDENYDFFAAAISFSSAGLYCGKMLIRNIREPCKKGNEIMCRAMENMRNQTLKENEGITQSSD